MTVLSARNPRVVQIRKLIGRRRDRDDARCFVAEGPTLLAEALRFGILPEAVYIRSDSELEPEHAAAIQALDVTTYRLEPTVFDSIASTQTPQPVLSVLPYVDRAFDEIRLDTADGPLVVVLAGIREPGNAGTIIRSAAAAGATAVVTCDDAVDVYNPKVVRSSAGALFALPIVRDVPVGELFDGLAAASVRCIGLAGDATDRYDRCELTGAVALVVGNEAHGLGGEVRRRVDELIAIPLAADIESLNAASALTVVAFEAARQRRADR